MALTKNWFRDSSLTHFGVSGVPNGVLDGNKSDFLGIFELFGGILYQVLFWINQ
jgi:hypothetical protein